MQYGVRNVPANVDRLLRARAQREGRSLKDAVFESALAEQRRIDEDRWR